MTIQTTRWVLMTCCSALFLACGQSDPPSDEPETDVTADDDPTNTGGATSTDQADYYPLVDGTAYQFTHTSGWVETVNISSTTHEGEAAFLFTDAGDPTGEHNESTMVKVGTAVYRVEKRSFDSAGNELPRVEYDPGFIRTDSAWVNEPVGTQLTIGYTRTEFALDGTENVDEREHIYTIEAVDETTQTAAGTFQNCIRVRRKRGWVSDTPGSEAQEKLFWFAPGIGKVREETLTSGNSELLIEYSIPE